mmetsp:Transcript_25527/g.47945  ORF Transcript_25527/g.47945 Transcript_25527/m.47945 type:complete len:268 (-) Transcript_25527:796-1599(-)
MGLQQTGTANVVLLGRVGEGVHHSLLLLLLAAGPVQSADALGLLLRAVQQIQLVQDILLLNAQILELVEVHGFAQKRRRLGPKVHVLAEPGHELGDIADHHFQPLGRRPQPGVPHLDRAVVLVDDVEGGHLALQPLLPNLTVGQPVLGRLAQLCQQLLFGAVLQYDARLDLVAHVQGTLDQSPPVRKELPLELLPVVHDVEGSQINKNVPQRRPLAALPKVPGQLFAATERRLLFHEEGDDVGVPLGLALRRAYVAPPHDLAKGLGL